MKYWCLVLALIILVPFSARAESSDPQVRVLARTSKSWDGQLLPTYPKGQPEITILEISIPAGTELPMHLHPVINAGVLLQGELAVITEQGEVLILEPGDAIVEVVDKWHYGLSQGQEPARIIVFYAGILDEPVTVSQ
ncbi:cupin domain-containing protein [Desulfonatronovibrio hydrogenovorans]|uniref:cupin domain-containing protein n=1 Tax=Desulfonatronovibrio hydrogenovorans TaxID=53245 RepID=UPI00048F0332|nr:cupin domain-containing protein [Desulfonatronovibrio hydrogenovorans]